MLNKGYGKSPPRQTVSKQCIELKGKKSSLTGTLRYCSKLAPYRLPSASVTFLRTKSRFFFKGGLIVSQLGKNGEVLAVLQGPWKASGGGGLALEHEAEG